MAGIIDRLARQLLPALVLVCAMASSGCDRQSQRDAALCRAVRDGDVAAARDALEAGAHPEAPCPGEENEWTDGWPALAVAIYQRDVDMVGLLLEVEADTEQPFGLENSALELATKRGDLDIFRMLLEAGAEEHEVFVDDGKGSLLHSAAWFGRGDIVRFLIERGEDLDSAMSDERTPLMLASFSFSPDAFWVLADAGADVTCLDDQGSSALHYALISWHISLGSGDLDTVERLLEMGVPLEARSGWAEGQTALILAVEFCAPAVPLLLDAGADVHAQDDEGRTALYHAAYYAEDDATLRVLIDQGSDLEAVAKSGLTPLAYAMYRMHADRVRLLLVYGADPQTVLSSTGQTVLELAIELAETAGDKWQEERRLIADILKAAADGG